MATTYLSRTSGTPTDSKKTTLSVWLKRSGLGTGTFFGGGADSNNMTFINFNPNGKIFLQSSSSGSNTLVFVTTQVFRDTSAWYHIVVAIDTTQGTASNRVKLYVNGVQVTAFDTETQPSQNLELEWNKSGKTLEIGKYLFQSTYSLYDGSMSYVSFVDGTQELPTVFGETDSTTGEWKIKTDITPSVAWGNNGFLILKNGNSLTDESSNSNNFTLGGGTLTKTEDCPSNNFPTWNPAFMPFNIGNGRADNGGTTIGSPGGDSSSLASMGARSGKYYWEIRVQNAVNTRSCGVVRSDLQGQSSTSAIYPGGNGNASNFTSAYNMVNGFVQTVTGGTQAQQGSLATLTTGDFLGVALDIDNLDIKWYKNDSLVTTTSLTSAWIENGLFIMPCNRLDGNQFVEYNFGNGFFGSTQLTGTTYQGTGGLGIFKYAPPTGFTALSTKGINL
jgi:hypothetical protein